jgi:hypothetical protein
LTTGISSKGIISEVWLDGATRDIMLICETDDPDLEVYEQPFIIHDFLFSDINLLERDDKA